MQSHFKSGLREEEGFRLEHPAHALLSCILDSLDIEGKRAKGVQSENGTENAVNNQQER
jgi:hypothetical protein